jgi:hypothetical protein
MNSLVAFGQKDDPQLKLLTKAYKKKSAKLTTEFLNNWAAETSFMTEDEFSQLNDTIKEAYGFISQIKPSGFFGRELIVTVVDSIYYRRGERGEDFYFYSKTIYSYKTDFRPLPQYRQVLIFNSKYSDIIYKFKSCKSKCNKYLSREGAKRCRFLSENIFRYVDDCDRWDNFTFITISKDLKRIVFPYHTRYTSGNIYYIKKGNSWVETYDERIRTF